MAKLVRTAASIGLVALAGCAASAPEPRIGSCDALDAGSPRPHDLFADGGLSLPAGSHLLWVGAHPDDEVMVAPLLGEACVHGGVRCTFLVATRGEGGNCKLPGGCSPNLAAVRDAELRASAALYDAGLVHWDLGNQASNVDQALALWEQKVGGRDALVKLFAEEIARLAPDVIVTFDPRHGATCHPDHRVAGALVLLAAEQRSFSSERIYLLASRFATEVDRQGHGCWIGFLPYAEDDAAVRALDATRLMSTNRAAWSHTLDTLLAHPSQFEPLLVELARRAPPAAQRVFLLRRSDAITDDPRYAGACQ